MKKKPLLYTVTKHYGGYSMIICKPTTLSKARSVVKMHKSSKGYFRGKAVIRIWKLEFEDQLISSKYGAVRRGIDIA